jgi:hypothetical protein
VTLNAFPLGLTQDWCFSPLDAWSCFFVIL